MLLVILKIRKCQSLRAGQPWNPPCCWCCSGITSSLTGDQGWALRFVLSLLKSSPVQDPWGSSGDAADVSASLWVGVKTTLYKHNSLQGSPQHEQLRRQAGLAIWPGDAWLLTHWCTVPAVPTVLSKQRYLQTKDGKQWWQLGCRVWGLLMTWRSFSWRLSPHQAALPWLTLQTNLTATARRKWFTNPDLYPCHPCRMRSVYKHSQSWSHGNYS